MASNRLLVIDSTSYLLGIALGHRDCQVAWLFNKIELYCYIHNNIKFPPLPPDKYPDPSLTQGQPKLLLFLRPAQTIAVAVVSLNHCCCCFFGQPKQFLCFFCCHFVGCSVAGRPCSGSGLSGYRLLSLFAFWFGRWTCEVAIDLVALAPYIIVPCITTLANLGATIVFFLYHGLWGTFLLPFWHSKSLGLLLWAFCSGPPGLLLWVSSCCGL